jgi:TctA family transporter
MLMGYFEAVVSGLAQAVSWNVLPLLLAAAIYGLIIGVIPGLSGHFAMAMLIPFIYGIEPAAGLAILVGAHATVSQGGGLTAILFATPGGAQNAATLMDGCPMTQKGLAGRAIGAAMTACSLGAVFSVIVLALMLPVLREVVLFFGPAEFFMLAVLALTTIAILGKTDLIRGLIAALLGLLLSFVGMEKMSGVARYAFGSLSLWDGIELVPLVLGLFAVSEMITLWLRGGSMAYKSSTPISVREMQQQIFAGVFDTFKNWWLVIRCSAIGTLIGVIPGLGAGTAAFVAYAHAKQTSKDPESFGKGNIEGVIGPESANDAVEGGALASTLAFGIPGSSSMAILLGGLMVLGVNPGPELINQRTDLVFLMIFTIVIGNVFGSVMGVFLMNPLARLTFVKNSISVPILLVIILTGAFAVRQNWFDIGVALVFGIIGYFMAVLNYSRPSLLIGFILGYMVERNLYMSIQLYGSKFFLQPIAFGLLLIILATLAYNIVSIVKDKKKGGMKSAG